MASGSKELIDLCLESGEVVLEGGGSLFAAIQFLKCLEMLVRKEASILF